ncbi:hypothetical protein HOD96_02345 [Candidatus Falkowbacteria bacterium]|jgi:hypothetical protein|nr:hypothetical protein [Candidatus Falkowbacteria bacterium]MBT4433453.1 hypothetical protein [Candidatus Falkowbacteria bacterium]
MIKKIILILIIFGGVSFGVWKYKENQSKFLAYHLKSIGIKIEQAEDFLVTEISDPKKGSKARTITAKKDQEEIKIKIVNNVEKDEALNYIEDKKENFESLYKLAKNPYPEAMKKQKECPEEYRPEVKKHGYGEYFLTYAGEDLGYGICKEDLVRYKAVLGYFYCENISSFIKIEYFTSKEKNHEEMNSLINSFRCE